MGYNQYLKESTDKKTKVFVEPSKEAQFLLRYFGWLVSPKDGKGNLVSRFFRMIIVSPYSQLTLFSFDLQTYTFEIFHQTWISRIVHFVCMILVNTFIVTGLSQVLFFGNEPTLLMNAGLVYGFVLAIWYSIIACRERLWLWALVMVVAVAGITGLGLYLGQTFFDYNGSQWSGYGLFFNPWLWSILSAFAMVLSHIPEPKLAPRVVSGDDWISVQDYVLNKNKEEKTSMFKRIFRLCFFPIWGTTNEFWASPRFMPYTFLAFMARLGYAPQTYSKIQDYVDQAVASGNPALDYIGIGGGAMMQLPDKQQ